MIRRGDFWIGMAIGAAAGVVSALLYAPKSGDEMRHDIRSKANEVESKAGEAWSDAKESAASAVRATGEHARSMVDQGKELMSSTSTRVKEAIAAGQEAVTQKRHEIEDRKK